MGTMKRQSQVAVRTVMIVWVLSLLLAPLGAMAQSTGGAIAGVAFVFGLLVDVNHGALLGQHALAYTYLAQRTIPVTPVFLNTFFPPNQPKPARCLALGAALRRLIDSLS